jgi:hypothetical protein
MKVSDLLINKAELHARLGPPRNHDGSIACTIDFTSNSPSSRVKTKEDAYATGWSDALQFFADSCKRMADMDRRRQGDKEEGDDE